MDPGEVRLSSVEVVLKCVNECGEKGPGLKPAGLSDGQDSFNPAIALFAGGTLGVLSPKHAEAQDSFSVVVGGGNALFFQKEPQAGKFSFQPAGKLACGILAISVEGDQPDEAGIEGPPLAGGGPNLGHMAQPLKLGKCPVYEPGQFWIRLFGNLPGLSDEVGQAGLAVPLYVEGLACF